MSKKVLIIDDEANVRLALRSRLSKLDCDVLEARTLEDARTLIAEHREDLRVVILDLRLVAAEEEPGRESGLKLLKDELVGTQACVQCRTLRFNPNVIVLTAFPNVPSCRAAFLAGVMDYLDKNASGVWDELIERVTLALEYSKEQTLFAARNWIEAHLDGITHKYAGQTLALQGETVVAAADSLEQLKDLLKTRDLRPEDYLLVTISTDQEDRSTR